MQTLKYSALALAVALFAACDKVPLLAPAGSNVTLAANATTIPTGGTVGLTAFVTESSGTPVQNGTTVRFTTTLGSVSPVETQTTNGLAVATFQAGSTAGVAEVHAVSGGATGTTGTGTNTTAGNVVKITIGAAAVNTVTVSANPTSVSPNGGSAQVTATVFDTNGGTLAGIPVIFSADQGVIAPSTAVTDASGQATATLVTSADTTITVTAGTKTATVKVTARSSPGITITCTPSSGTGSNCGNVQASSSNNTATVVFTVTKGSNTSSLRDVTVDFGDGSSQSVGTLSGGPATVSHTYSGPSDSSSRTYTATARAVDVNGEVTSASTTVTVTPRGQLTVSVVADTSSAAVPTVGKQVTFTATVNGGEPLKFDWDFGDGSTATTTTTGTTTGGGFESKVNHVYRTNKLYTTTVTVTTTDGRTGTARTEFIVSGI